MDLHAPELLLLIAIDIFLILSLVTCLFEREFPTPICYLLQLSALAGFGQIYVSKDFLNVFDQGIRFWYSLSYLMVAVASVFASNLYLMVSRRDVPKGIIFFGSLTAPAIISAMFFISVYIHDIDVPLSFFPSIPLGLVLPTVALSLGLLALGVILSMEPNILQRFHLTKGITMNIEKRANPVVRAANMVAQSMSRRLTLPFRRGDAKLRAFKERMGEFIALLQDKEAEGCDVGEFREIGRRILESFKAGDAKGNSKMLDEAIERLKTVGPKVPLRLLLDQQRILEEKKEVKK